MGKFDFLASGGLETGGSPAFANARGVNPSIGTNSPMLKHRMIDAPTLDAPIDKVGGLVTREAAGNFINTLLDASLQTADEKNKLIAGDAWLAYNNARRELMYGMDSDGNPTGYMFRSGRDAVEGHASFKQSLDQLTVNTLKSVSPAVRVKLANRVNQTRNQTLDTTASFSSGQYKRWQTESLAAEDKAYNAELMDMRLTPSTAMDSILARAQELYPSGGKDDFISKSKRSEFIDQKTSFMVEYFRSEGEGYNETYAYYQSFKDYQTLDRRIAMNSRLSQWAKEDEWSFKQAETKAEELRVKNFNATLSSIADQKMDGTLNVPVETARIDLMHKNRHITTREHSAILTYMKKDPAAKTVTDQPTYQSLMDMAKAGSPDFPMANINATNTDLVEPAVSRALYGEYSRVLERNRLAEESKVNKQNAKNPDAYKRVRDTVGTGSFDKVSKENYGLLDQSTIQSLINKDRVAKSKLVEAEDKRFLKLLEASIVTQGMFGPLGWDQKEQVQYANAEIEYMRGLGQSGVTKKDLQKELLIKYRPATNFNSLPWTESNIPRPTMENFYTSKEKILKPLSDAAKRDEFGAEEKYMKMKWLLADYESIVMRKRAMENYDTMIDQTMLTENKPTR